MTQPALIEVKPEKKPAWVEASLRASVKGDAQCNVRGWELKWRAAEDEPVDPAKMCTHITLELLQLYSQANGLTAVELTALVDDVIERLTFVKTAVVDGKTED